MTNTVLKNQVLHVCIRIITKSAAFRNILALFSSLQEIANINSSVNVRNSSKNGNVVSLHIYKVTFEHT